MSVAAQTSKARPGVWAGLFFSNVAVIAVLHITGALEPPAPYILFALNFVLLVPFLRATRQASEQAGAMSPALRAYNWRFAMFSAVYAAAMIVAGNIYGSLAEGSPLLWLLATVPLVPVLGMIWTMYRYLREEKDEYLRHRATTASLVGLALVLVVGTSWGFLETFGLVPHVWNWWVFPAWAIGLGIGMAFTRIPGDE